MKFKYIFFDWGGVLGTNKCEFINSYAHRLDLLAENFHKTIEYLHLKGYTLGIISNTSVKREALIKSMLKHNIYHYFKTIVLSSDEGMCKKKCSEIFMTALKSINAKPYECLFVGNSFENDMIGATNIGMYTAFINNNAYDLTKKPNNIKINYHLNSIIDLWSII